VKDLLPRQLAGADLTGAKLPEQLEAFPGIVHVSELVRTAATVFLSLLVACVYSWLTISATKDPNLLTNSTSSPLPIIQTPIPIAHFYIVAPALPLALYFYLHLYLQRLWEELAELPAIFPDGKPLNRKISPWLIAGIVRAHIPRLLNDRPTLSRLQVHISQVLAWWFVPFTLLLFWLRYLTRHDWRGTAFHMGLLTTAMLSGLWFQRVARSTLKRTPVGSNGDRRSGGWSLVIAGFSILVAAVMISDGAINGYIPGSSPASTRLRHRAFVPQLFSYVGGQAFANFREQEVSTRPDNWFLREDLDLPRLVKGAQLRGADLRNLLGEGAFMMKADLRDAKLQDADLHNAQLQMANLSLAQLQNADLQSAQLQVAILSSAQLQDARLRYAQLQEADLPYAWLQRADLGEAQLQKADLQGAQLQQAFLYGAQLQQANLRDANLQYASLEAADLQQVENLVQTQLNDACVTETTKLPKGLKRPAPCPTPD
jgi:uncharacterized protein YjbI with pentapeptide repeats